MDIIVTIPKSRLRQVADEERMVAEGAARGEKWRYWWNMGSRPKSLEIGERCYFVWWGAIRAWHEVVGIESSNDGRYCKVWLDPVIHEIEPVVMKGFQGFRYVKSGMIPDTKERR